MRFGVNAAFYTVLNFRYAALVLPVGAVAYLAGLPGWLVVLAAVLLAGAFVAELLTSVTNGLAAAAQIEAQRTVLGKMMDDIESYANGGWVGLNGRQGTDEGEGPDEGEGGTPVPAQG